MYYSISWTRKHFPSQLWEFSCILRWTLPSALYDIGHCSFKAADSQSIDYTVPTVSRNKILIKQRVLYAKLFLSQRLPASLISKKLFWNCRTRHSYTLNNQKIKNQVCRQTSENSCLSISIHLPLLAIMSLMLHNKYSLFCTIGFHYS